jgi:hypothetical protein
MVAPGARRCIVIAAELWPGSSTTCDSINSQTAPQSQTGGVFIVLKGILRSDSLIDNYLIYLMCSARLIGPSSKIQNESGAG